MTTPRPEGGNDRNRDTGLRPVHSYAQTLVMR